MELPQHIRKLLQGSCTVIGLGVSNLPLIEFLVSHGASVTARDKKTLDALPPETAAKLQELGVPLLLGEDYLSSITEDTVFRSPGLRPDLPELQAVRSRGGRVTSEMELFFALSPAHLIGITGSDGKTTTTTLTHHFLEAERELHGGGRIYLGGNIGKPLLPLVEQMTSRDYAVVELSSFQLMDIDRSPERAAITNLSPNHMDWHRDSMEEYATAKANIFCKDGCRLLVTNAENPTAMALTAECAPTLSLFSSARSAAELPPHDGAGIYLADGWIVAEEKGKTEQLLRADEILLPGRHNLENYMTAIALTRGLVSGEAIRSVAKSFRGVRHRLEPAGCVDGVTYINSSIDSSPSRTLAALSAIPGSPIVILGGRDKHVPFDGLARVLGQKAKAAVLTGEASGQLKAALDAAAGDLPVYTEADLPAAVRRARAIAAAGDTVLLSPACTSYDAFRNFEERGDLFCRLVREMNEPVE